MLRLAALLLLPASAFALDPAEVLVVANADVPDSRAVARHYLAKRKVPAGNLLELSLPAGEDISRADYDAKLAAPVRAAVRERGDRIKVVLTVYGVPLRVGPLVLDAAGQARAVALKDLVDATAAAAKAAPGDAELRRRAEEAAIAHRRHTGEQSRAAVDSELMLVLWPAYDLSRWQVNPLYWQVAAADRARAPRTLMTCRLDGPTPDIARRLVDDVIEVEAKGLTGKVYIDARGIKLDPARFAEQVQGYEGYDESFREAAALLKGAGMDVTLDDKEPVFPPKSCPDAALYAGWYSHGKYVDGGTYAKGAVAWHLASSEAVSLRKADSTLWCPNLLTAGVAATLGPVAEPYTAGFPKPAEFFGFLVTGKYTLVETYARTTLLTSWMMVLVGDPLYNPFAAAPKLKEADVRPSPRPPAR